MTGTVRDSSGAIVQKARITLTEVDKNTNQYSVSDRKGVYEFTGIRVGNYIVKADVSGFAVSETAPFTLTVGHRQQVDLVLKPGSDAMQITVSAVDGLLETESSDRGQTITHREIEQLPLNGRSYADLALLTPGVRKSTNENTAANNKDASYNINGMRSQVNNFLLDGLDNNSYSINNQGFSMENYRPSPDAVQEFRIVTSNASAEYGRSAGGIINVTTRSGQNALHGLLWDYLRNTALNAWGPFLGTGTKPALNWNQFGGTLGGPVLRNRLFFFGEYEGFRRVDHALQNASLPGTNERNGIFVNSSGKPVALINPITGANYPDGVIPSSDITPFAKAVLAALPPQTPGDTDNDANLVSNPPATTRFDKGGLRLDYYINPKMNVFARWSDIIFHAQAAPDFPLPAGGDNNGNTYLSNQQLASGLNWTVSPLSTLELRFGYTWNKSGKTPLGLGQPSFLQAFNVPNIPTDPSVATALNEQLITGYTQLGQQDTNPQIVNPYLTDIKANYTILHGRHSWKFGYEYERLNEYINSFHPQYGIDTYAGQFSRAVSAQSSAKATQRIYNTADFELGARSSYELATLADATELRRMHYGYVQDDWKATNALTVNIGLRYEFVTPIWEQHNRTANFDPATTSLQVAKPGSIFQRSLIHPQWNGFNPRLGFSYSINNKTVVRAGFGINDIQYFRYAADDQLVNNEPFIVDATVNQLPPFAPTKKLATQPLCASLDSDPSTCFRTLMMGYPNGFVAPGQINTLASETRYMAANTPISYAETAHLTVQRQLSDTMILEVGYVYNHALHLPVLTDYNQASSQTHECAVSSDDCLTLQQRRPLPTFQSITQLLYGGFLQYDALQTRFERRTRHGLTIVNSFTWSHAIDDASDLNETQGDDGAAVNRSNIAGDRGNSGYDQRLNDTLAVIYDLPFGRGARFGASMPHWLDAIVGGWTAVAFNSVTSGLPVNPIYQPVTDAQVSSDGYEYRPSYVSSAKAVYAPRSKWIKTDTNLQGIFDASQIIIPNIDQPFGNAGRNSLRGAGYGSLDFSLHKSFSLYEGIKLDLRGEAFNALNAVNYQSPNSNLSASSTAFGSYNSFYDPREIQIAVRLSF